MIFGWRDRPEPQPELVPKARRRLDRGMSHLDDGHGEAARTELEKAAELGEEAATDEGLETAARAHEQLAELHAQAGLSGARRKALEAACQAGEDAGTTDGNQAAARASYELGVRHLEQERQDEARKALERAMDLGQAAATAAGTVTRARARRVLGLLADAQGRTDEAVDQLSQALDDATATGEVAGLEAGAQAGIDLGHVLWQHGDLDDAGQALEQAAAIGEQVASPEGLLLASKAARLRGELAAERGHHEEALHALQEAQALAEQTDTAGGRLSTARAAWSMARVHQQQGAADQALRWYEQATVLAAEAGNPQGEALFAEIQLDRGELLEAQEQPRAASDVYAAAALRGADSELPHGIEAAREAGQRNMAMDLPPPGPDEEPSVVIPQAANAHGDPGGQPPPTEDPSAEEAPAPATERPKVGDEMSDEPTGQPVPSQPTGDTEPRRSVDDLWAVLDRADTVLEIAPRRQDASGVEATIAQLDQALEHWGPDARLVERRARCRDLLGRWREAPGPLRRAIEDYGHAFELKGGRVDPRTHDPGPSFFFAWGRALYDLATLEDDPDLYEEARQRLTTGYQMTPRGADHTLASAILARVAFHLAETGRDPEGYARAIELYEQLEADDGGFAMAPEDHALWARALAHRAEASDDPEAYREAYERMARAYEDR